MLLERIMMHIDSKDMESLKSLLAVSEEMEILYTLHDLSPDDLVIVFRLLAKDKALMIFEELDTDMQQSLIKSFTDERVNEFVNNMAPDDRVRLLDELPAIVAKKLIASLSPEEREATNILMGYESETAGRIMTTEYISLKPDMTVEQALAHVRVQAKDKETIYTLFVTDNAKKLEGVLTLKELLVAEHGSVVSDIMAKKAISVQTDTDQEEVAKTLQELDLLAIPVVDREGRLVGIVTIDDAVDIIEEEATEDILDKAGFADVTNNESDRSEVLVNGSLWQIWKVRLPFLLATLVIFMFSGVVIGEFEDALESIAVVAMFIPLIMGMGGNVGTQSSTIFARGFLLGHIEIANFIKHLTREIGIGISIGAVVGLLSGIISSLWLGMPMLGLAVGLSLMATAAVASLLGFVVPFVLIKFNLDLAAGSDPIITSIKDIIGLLIYFLFVTAFLGNAM